MLVAYTRQGTWPGRLGQLFEESWKWHRLLLAQHLSLLPVNAKFISTSFFHILPYFAKVCHVRDNCHPLSSVKAMSCKFPHVHFAAGEFQVGVHWPANWFLQRRPYFAIFSPVSDSYLRRAENDTLMAVVQHSSFAGSYQSWNGLVWFGMIWYGMVWYVMVW